MSTGKLADPAFRHERAKKARAAQETPDFHIQKLIQSAPALTPEQAAKLRALLPPAPEEDSGEAA